MDRCYSCNCEAKPHPIILIPLQQLQYLLNLTFRSSNDTSDRCLRMTYNLQQNKAAIINHTTMSAVFLITYYARKHNASRVFAIVWASVCLSVTLVICIKTMQARITKSSLLAAPRSLVYPDKISCHWVQGFPSNRGVKEGYPLKRRHFAVIGSFSVKTVADRYMHCLLYTSPSPRD